MLSKERRITQKDLFRSIFRKGRSFSSDFVSVKMLAVPLMKTKFAFIVPNNVSKKAVERNKIRRRARALVFKNLPLIKEGYAILLFFKKESLKLNFPDLEREILLILKRARVVR